MLPSRRASRSRFRRKSRSTPRALHRFVELSQRRAHDALGAADERAIDAIVAARVGRRQTLMEHLEARDVFAGFGRIHVRVEFGQTRKRDRRIVALVALRFPRDAPAELVGLAHLLLRPQALAESAREVRPVGVVEGAQRVAHGYRPRA